MSDPDIFSTLQPGRKNWAIASIHGEAERLRSLHEQLADRIEVGDSLIYLGNIIGRSNAVADTIEEVLLFRRALLARRGADPEDITFLRGSQEEMWQKLLQLQFAPNPSSVLEWMLDQGVGGTLDAYNISSREGIGSARDGAVAISKWTTSIRESMRAADGHNQLFSALRRAAFTEDGTLLFVNAGLDRSRPLSEQRDSFWWGGQGFADIQEPYNGYRRIIRGYSPQHPGIETGLVTTTIDGGAGFGGDIIAACFDAEGELIDSINA